jgi:hypothetical protein
VVVGLAGLLLLGAGIAEARLVRERGSGWDAEARAGATRAAALFASLSAHLRASGGDRRFAERMAADEPVVAEILADVAFVQHLGRQERAQLVRFEPVSARPAGPYLAEVLAREYWITRVEPAGDGATRSDVVLVRYALRREAGGWRVADWVVEAGGAGQGAEAPR